MTSSLTNGRSSLVVDPAEYKKLLELEVKSRSLGPVEKMKHRKDLMEVRRDADLLKQQIDEKDKDIMSLNKTLGQKQDMLAALQETHFVKYGAPKDCKPLEKEINILQDDIAKQEAVREDVFENFSLYHTQCQRLYVLLGIKTAEEIAGDPDVTMSELNKVDSDVEMEG